MVIALLASAASPAFVSAENDPVDPAQLQKEIADRKAQIQTINSKLGDYKKKIVEYAKKSSSLMNEIALIENDTAMGQLDVLATEAEVDTAQLELQIVNGQIDETNAKLTHERDLLASMLLAIHKQDAQGGAFELLVNAKTFDDVFKAASDLHAVNGDLRKTVAATKTTRESLQDDLETQTDKLQGLEELRVKLEVQIRRLQEKKAAKEVLAAQTQSSEQEYRELVGELRQEQQAIAYRINELQNEVDASIDLSDPNPSAITWPVRGIITTLFHDPTYPFRYLFEHSGLDIAVPQGTPLEAAAPGVVAWARTGTRDYGNYVMIIHTNGLATLYAHLSRIDVKQDQIVSRGDIIGLSGGRPGSPGAGLSTGPHVHFEVRKGGIPVNPLPFLPK
jgi:murein DD-endopeptidase MepM/ murein hydrolase activator NlpD